MHSFKPIIQKFANKGEKTGWTYVDIPQDILIKLKLKNKKEFRIKGVMDDVKFERLATYPIGEGNFIIAINAELRKKLGKKEGAMLSVKFELDKSEALKSQELLDCLAEDKIAIKQFNSLLVSHQNYFHRYVYTAKGADTKAGRIVNVINAMYKKMNFGEMIRSLKKKD
ncbi:DUF1905 domain-containing protein [Sediminibacterium sp.]|uniref:DUF1905 domain-containing protein n=1 Tax=Sediminibacterium sp. TaxID=1917865 RepID=UPI0027202189|nr:DUF1905 domain-containing protein [Sediminibacterium sp.]MDO9000327.1 DUF1905 domain-containing protein [Bacteroidota bacterium]MDP3147104.1 DUF1905 domain-containing protein [Bacteroidota bacterium]MDP3567367.1 DUF1905 domain-containing protein [Sediminibacterium sp.]